MTTSGTYSFFPSTGQLVLAAFARIQIKRSEITTEHLANATNEVNFLQAEWANKGPLLFTVDLQSVALVQGTPTYDVPVNTLTILDVWISIPNGDGTTTDRIITPMSRSEYAAMPDKLEQSAPTSFWYDRLASPTITLWPNPDQSDLYTLNYYRFTQIQDAVLTGALQPAIPYRWLDAYTAGLARRLRVIYPMATANDTPLAALIAEETRTYNIASSQDVEQANFYISPNTSSYWR